MSTFDTHKKESRARIIVAGDSGSGKTGLLASVANAGYRLCIIDADNGLDILDAYLTDDGRARTHFISLQDDIKAKSSAWGQFVKILNNGWVDGDEDLGHINTWGSDTVLVLDTLNFLGKSAMRAVMSRAGRSLDSHPELQHWGEAQRYVEARIAFLCSPSIKCHIIVNTHLNGVTDDVGRSRDYPATGTGKALGFHIGDYFNTLVRLDIKAMPNDVKRIIRTVSDHKMSLKNTEPNMFKVEEDFDLGQFISKLSATEP